MRVTGINMKYTVSISAMNFLCGVGAFGGLLPHSKNMRNRFSEDQLVYRSEYESE